jgi:hypothetical protein
MLDTKYSPYPQKDVRVENICGSFTNYVECRQFQGITRRNMGRCGESCLFCGDFTVVFSCRHVLWCFAVEISLWCFAVDMCCGDFTVEILLWCLAVDMCCGVLLWCFAVDMCCGDFTVEILLWCLAVDMCCGVLLWCFAVEISLWCLALERSPLTTTYRQSSASIPRRGEYHHPQQQGVVHGGARHNRH